jgi:hypothetical protein
MQPTWIVSLGGAARTRSTNAAAAIPAAPAAQSLKKRRRKERLAIAGFLVPAW